PERLVEHAVVDLAGGRGRDRADRRERQLRLLDPEQQVLVVELADRGAELGGRQVLVHDRRQLGRILGDRLELLDRRAQAAQGERRTGQVLGRGQVDQVGVAGVGRWAGGIRAAPDLDQQGGGKQRKR